MTLTQMTYFEAVCIYKNVTKAADALFVSRSAVSRALKELETEWNVVLFKRSRTGVDLTEDGEKIREMFKEFNTAYSNLRKYMSQTTRVSKPTTLHIGITSTTGNVFFKDFFPRFMKLYPDINLQFNEYTPAECLSVLEDGTCDFFITPHMTPEAKKSDFLDVHFTYTAELVVGISKNHPYAKEQCLNQTQLQTLKFATLLTPLPTNVLNTPFDDTSLKFCSDDSIVMRTSQEQLIHSAVANGFCATILPRDFIEGWDDVCTIPFIPANYAQVNILWNKNSVYSEIANIFIDYMRQYKWNQ